MPFQSIELHHQPKAAIRFRAGIQGVTKPTAPGTPGLEEACQGEHDSAPTLLPPHLSDLGHPMELKSGLFFPVIVKPIGPVVF